MAPLNLLTDIEGVAVGHATDLALGSGVTVIVFDDQVIASGSVLGGAPGGRETALLDPAMTVQAVDAFVLSGGSAFGSMQPAARSRACVKSAAAWPSAMCGCRSCPRRS